MTVQTMLATLGRLYLRLWGFTVFGQRPPVAKCVILAAPHTSNWDVPLMLSVAAIYGIRVRWIGKHTLFYPPYGWLIRLLGGLPVDRRKSQDYVAQMREAFERADSLYLLITPEGTRSRSEYWKSGFYYIAQAAKVPLALASMDFRTRKVGIARLFEPTGDLEADMQVIRDFYAGMEGLRKDCFGPVRVRPRDQRPSLEATGADDPAARSG